VTEHLVVHEHDWQIYNQGYCGGCEACGSLEEYVGCECGALWEEDE